MDAVAVAVMAVLPSDPRILAFLLSSCQYRNKWPRLPIWTKRAGQGVLTCVQLSPKIVGITFRAFRNTWEWGCLMMAVCTGVCVNGSYFILDGVRYP